MIQTHSSNQQVRRNPRQKIKSTHLSSIMNKINIISYQYTLCLDVFIISVTKQHESKSSAINTEYEKLRFMKILVLQLSSSTSIGGIIETFFPFYI